MRSYQFARDALAPWWNRLTAEQQLDLSALPDFVRHILSLEQSPVVEVEVKEICWMLHCLMHRESRKWLSVAQVSLPYQERIGAKTVSQAKLKSRVGASVLGNQDIKVGHSKSFEQMQLRRRFLDFLVKCIPSDERERYPFLLKLTDSQVVGTNKAPNNESTGVDVAAWNVVNYLSTALLMERGKANRGFKLTPETPLDALELHYQGVRRRLEQLVDDYPAMQAFETADPSEDSLFAQMAVQAAANRHYLESEAFKNRTTDLLDMQIKVVTELEECAADGLDDPLDEAWENSQIDWLAFVSEVLAPTMRQPTNPMTESVQATISAQIEVILASARFDHFANEWQMNAFLTDEPLRAKAMLWVLLTWCYQHDYEIANEDPHIQKSKVPVVTTKSKVHTSSQVLSTLRRMLSTLAFSYQWEAPSARRLALYATQNVAIREIVQRKLDERLKRATLSQWEAAARKILPWDDYCRIVDEAELGAQPRR